jgi:hypothetical protein
MIKQYKTILIPCVLFLFIVFFLGLPFTHWWFNGDDFSGIALGKNMQTIKSFLSHFIEGNVNKYFYPSHHQCYTPYGANSPQPLHFFNVYYRPIHCAYLACAYWLFGLNAYAYYLVNVFLHAFNTTILFTILRWFSGYFAAIFCALLFALHPQIGFRFGAPVNFQYYLNVLLLLLSVITLKQYLEYRHYWWPLFLSILFFTIAIFARETAIVFPAILFIGLWLYQKKISLLPLFYAVAAMGYLAVRLCLYPVRFTLQKSFSFHFVSCLFLRFNELLVFIYDTLSLSWLPYGHKWLRLIILMIIAIFFMVLFLRSKQKIVIGFLGISYLLMLWPSFLGAYSPRYFYEASPFLMIAFAILIKECIYFSQSIKRIFISACFGLMVFYSFCTYTNLRCREAKLFTMKRSFLALTRDQRITSGIRPLCFLAFPVDGFGTGIEQAAWLFLTSPQNAVYYDPSTILTQSDSNIIENARWYMRCAPYYTKNYFTITKTVNSIRLTSRNPQKISFFLQDGYLSLGTKTIYKTALVKGQSVITDFTLAFDQKYLNQKSLIITWDYEKQQFIIQ